MKCYKWMTKQMSSFADPDMVYEMGKSYKKTFLCTTMKSAVAYVICDAVFFDNRLKQDMVLVEGESPDASPFCGPGCSHIKGELNGGNNVISNFVGEWWGTFTPLKIIAECSWEQHMMYEKAFHKAAGKSRKALVEHLNSALRDFEQSEIPLKPLKVRDAILENDMWFWDEHKNMHQL